MEKMYNSTKNNLIRYSISLGCTIFNAYVGRIGILNDNCFEYRCILIEKTKEIVL